MIEAVVAIVGAIIGLFIYRAVGQKAVDAGQRTLETKVKEIEKKDAGLEQKISEIATDADKQIEEITNEQNKDQSTQSLVDFFNKPKS